MDIALITYCIHTLANNTIADLIHADLISRTISSLKVVVMIIVQAKVVLYYDKHPKDDFILLIVEIFGCFHQHTNDFLHHCANMAWSMKGLVVLLFRLYVHFIGRGCKWLSWEFMQLLSYFEQLWQQEKPLLGLVSS
jgi:hypothetical protein